MLEKIDDWIETESEMNKLKSVLICALNDVELYKFVKVFDEGDYFPYLIETAHGTIIIQEIFSRAWKFQDVKDKDLQVSYIEGVSDAKFSVSQYVLESIDILAGLTYGIDTVHVLLQDYESIDLDSQEGIANGQDKAGAEKNGKKDKGDSLESARIKTFAEQFCDSVLQSFIYK